MDRVERSKQKYQELFGSPATPDENMDPEFMNILQRFVFGEVCFQGNLADKMREMITVAVLTANQTLPQLKAHIGAALNVGVTPVEVKEAIYQCAPYIGFPKTLNGITQANDVFKERGITVPVEKQGTVTEETRFEEGLKVQKSIFGDTIDKMYETAPENQMHIQKYLSAMCFGDFYTRNGLDIKTRELLTFCIISALGGCENQVKAHVMGNVDAGNDKNTLITAITHCILYIGFPRTLNALTCINEVI